MVGVKLELQSRYLSVVCFRHGTPHRVPPDLRRPLSPYPVRPVAQTYAGYVSYVSGSSFGGIILKIPSEAHHLLTIPELLLHLFNIIESEPPNDTNQASKRMASRTLASCALVCHTWEEFATECLWRDLPSALCLLEVLGPLTYRKKVDDKGWVSHMQHSSRALQIIFLTVVT